jgi:hypothetical protein
MLGSGWSMTWPRRETGYIGTWAWPTLPTEESANFFRAVAQVLEHISETGLCYILASFLTLWIHLVGFALLITKRVSFPIHTIKVAK